MIAQGVCHSVSAATGTGRDWLVYLVRHMHLRPWVSDPG